MQNRSAVLFAILLCFTASISWGADTEVDETDLVPRMGILYKKFSTEAFTGLVVKYYTDGQIKTKSEYKNGLEVKIYEQYYENGQVEFAGTLSRMAGLARGVVLLMVGLIVLDVLAIYFSLISYDILTEWRDGFGFDSIRMGELEDAGLLVDLAYLLLQIPLIIVFLAWLLRLHRLAAAVQETGFSQNQVVWSWLVPILSWFRPFIIMKKCMLSLSSVENISRGLWMLRMWWVFWLLRSAGSSWVVQRSLAIDNEWASSGMRLDFLNEYFLYMFFEVSAAVFLILVTLKCTKLAQSQFASTSRVS